MQARLVFGDLATKAAIHLQKGLGMKYVHLCWISHILSDAESLQRVSSAPEIVWALGNGAGTGLEYIIRGRVLNQLRQVPNENVGIGLQICR
jgi:hypothetical protein